MDYILIGIYPVKKKENSTTRMGNEKDWELLGINPVERDT